ncbi:PfkB family carbohydrate kinase [Ferrimonas senticii]|uniref:PfkB family carbohydrate kinase n=1 Tax=Ferrimonas senticii TaxID=394566 RepID=UPI0004221B82|nr:PfkB family carbohydrate kinase [Ferrimonas senticii]
MTEREHQILELLRQDPLIPQQQLADQLGISRSAVAGHIMNLTRKGEIQGKGYILSPQRFAMVIGGANVDLCGRADSHLVNGDSNPGKLRCSAGGVGRNIADNLARLGSQVEFIGAVGDDDWGDMLKRSCRAVGIGVDHCLTVAGATSSSYLSIHDASGEMQLALNDMALIERLDASTLSDRDGPISRANALVIDANLSEAALAYLFDRHADDGILFVDPVSSVKAKRIKPFLAKVHTLKPNRLEAELLTGIEIRDHQSMAAAVVELHRLGVQRVLLSLGSEGAIASDGNEQRYIPATATCVNNVTGAGDALMAGLVHGYLQDWDWFTSVEFGLAAARLALAADNTISSTMSAAAVMRLLEEVSC